MNDMTGFERMSPLLEITLADLFEVKGWSVKEMLLLHQVYFIPLGNKLKCT